MPDIILNLLIFLSTAGILLLSLRKDGRWDMEQVKIQFRYFTCQSNVLCAAAALAMAVAGLAGDVPQWVWTLKYMGTVAVTVTLLTVFLFLKPSIGEGWYDILLKGARNLFMHLVNPLLAILSFCLFERRGMTFPQALWGLVPLALYGPLYLYKILYAPEGKRWDDFYHFNRGGRWPVFFAVMLVAAFIVCMLFMLVQNA